MDWTRSLLANYNVNLSEALIVTLYFVISKGGNLERKHDFFGVFLRKGETKLFL